MKNTKINNAWTDTVKIKLFRDSRRYRDDVFAAVNGRRYRIKRGSEVTVPKCIAEVIFASEIQDEKTAGLIAKTTEQYSSKYHE
ncbi:MAG: hypothetical protein PUB34_06445 [Clostridia bacterium]|nr:hypothetical protein [Clostridia bacterium]